MKFDFVIGNPPYHEETIGDNDTYAPPVYHKFMDAAYGVADRVELIHPARFLFNAGSTPKAWNEKMLKDAHFKILQYEEDSSKYFGNGIRGGIAISYRDNKKNFGSIGTFTIYQQLNSILHKVISNDSFIGMNQIVVSRTAYRLTDKLHNDHPEALSQLSQGHAYDMSTNIFERLPQVFYDEKPTDGKDYIQILGRENNERVYKFIQREYVNDVENLDKYKICIPKANGGGSFGEVLTLPIICGPFIGNTETFISIGNFEKEIIAINAMKFIKTKFSRCLLDILKTTQDITPEKFKYVPLQDFTDKSDIDWTKSIPEIDQQLYRKYRLSPEEISFIETHVKEMV